VKGEHFSPDVRELIELLATHGVRFLLIGGEAVIYHGYPRLTGDVGFWYEQTAENAARLFAALSEFWDGPVPGVREATELLEPTVVVRFGQPPHRVDVTSAIDGISFAHAWPRRVEEILELPDGRTVTLPILGLADLVRNKRAAGRHKDLDDVEHLEPLLRKT
jgi:hypothetical protein